MYLVTAVRDIYEASYNGGVEVVGIFDTEEKAFKAKARVAKWMEEEEYEDYEVFVSSMNVNRIEWYDVEEDI